MSGNIIVRCLLEIYGCRVSMYVCDVFAQLVLGEYIYIRGDAMQPTQNTETTLKTLQVSLVPGFWGITRT